MLNIYSRLKSLIVGNPKLPEEFITSAFADVKDLRYDLFLDFVHNDGILYQAKSTCLEFNQDIAHLYLRTEVDYLPAKGMKVECFFVLVKNKKRIPCSFLTKVVSSIKKHNAIYVDIVMPKEIVHKQRRNNVRVRVSASAIPNFKIWYGVAVFDSEIQKSRMKWEAIDRENFELVDISAGGFMLNLVKKFPLLPTENDGLSLIPDESEKKPLETSDYEKVLFLCTGNFYSQGKLGVEVALVSKVCRYHSPGKGRWDSFGLQFCRWAKITDDGVTWVDADEAGVSVVAQWIAPFMSKLGR